MPLIIQATIMSGKMIDGARWLVDLPWIQEGHTMSLNIPIKDPALIGYIGKQNNLDCVLDKEESRYSVSLSCKVTRIRHMVNTAACITESMAIVSPVNRLVEGVLLYALQPSKCDPRFIAAVRGGEPPRKA